MNNKSMRMLIAVLRLVWPLVVSYLLIKVFVDIRVRSIYVGILCSVWWNLHGLDHSRQNGRAVNFALKYAPIVFIQIASLIYALVYLGVSIPEYTFSNWSAFWIIVTSGAAVALASIFTDLAINNRSDAIEWIVAAMLLAVIPVIIFFVISPAQTATHLCLILGAICIVFLASILIEAANRSQYDDGNLPKKGIAFWACVLLALAICYVRVNGVDRNLGTITSSIEADPTLILKIHKSTSVSDRSRIKAALIRYFDGLYVSNFKTGLANFLISSKEIDKGFLSDVFPQEEFSNAESRIYGEVSEQVINRNRHLLPCKDMEIRNKDNSIAILISKEQVKTIQHNFLFSYKKNLDQRIAEIQLSNTVIAIEYREEIFGGYTNGSKAIIGEYNFTAYDIKAGCKQSFPAIRGHSDFPSTKRDRGDEVHDPRPAMETFIDTQFFSKRRIDSN